MNPPISLVVLIATLGCASTNQWQPSYCSRELSALIEDLAIEVESGELVPGQDSVVSATLRNNGTEEIEICLDATPSLRLDGEIDGSPRLLALQLNGTTLHVSCSRELLLKPGEGLNFVQRLGIFPQAQPGPATLTGFARVSKSPNCEGYRPEETLSSQIAVVISQAPVG